MKFSPFTQTELAAKQAELAQQTEERRIQALAASQQAIHTELRLRGLELGRKLTWMWRSTGQDDEKKFSRIANLPLESDDDQPTQCRVLYHPPLYVQGKNLGFDKTIVTVRLHDPASGAATDFRNLASFDRCGWIGYADPEANLSYMPHIQPGDALLDTVGQLLETLEAADFRIKES